MEEFESRLAPVLREGVTVVKMIFYKELKNRIARKFPKKDEAFVRKLSGAIVNETFGTVNVAEPFASFIRENQDRIADEINAVSVNFTELKIPLTDALRVQFLCDSQEGVDSEHVLRKAREAGILLEDREVPLPKTFMNLVRRLGAAHGVLDPQSHISH